MAIQVLMLHFQEFKIEKNPKFGLLMAYCVSIYFLKNVFRLYVLQVKQVKKKNLQETKSWPYIVSLTLKRSK